jgi:hypothetical protein
MVTPSIVLACMYPRLFDGPSIPRPFPALFPGLERRRVPEPRGLPAVAGRTRKPGHNQRNSPIDAAGLGEGAILLNGGKRRSLRGLAWHGLIERELVARDG